MYRLYFNRLAHSKSTYEVFLKIYPLIPFRRVFENHSPFSRIKIKSPVFFSKTGDICIYLFTLFVFRLAYKGPKNNDDLSRYAKKIDNGNVDPEIQKCDMHRRKCRPDKNRNYQIIVPGVKPY